MHCALMFNLNTSTNVRVLLTTGESQTPDPSLAEAGFEMQLSRGQHQQYDSQFQENGTPTITGTCT
jgi:hypothetical protein